jgi:hypothetical protein
MRRTVLSVSVVMLMTFCGSHAFSQTMSYTDAMQRLARTCGSDIRKHCKGANLGGEQVKNCLIANQAKISPSCKTGWSAVFASLQKRAVAQATIMKACEPDIRRFCGGVEAMDGNILECMTMAQKRISSVCRQTARDAGWM